MSRHKPNTVSTEHIRFEGVAKCPRRTRVASVRTFRQAEPRQRYSDAAEPPGDEFIFWLFQRSGLDVSRYRADPLQRRLAACLRSLQTSTVHQARKMIERAPRLLDTAMSAMLLGATGFFRDQPVFEVLSQLLPELRKEGRGLRIWSVGCSDGAELYSMAMMLAELELLESSCLLGTDCRRDCVLAAEQGEYDVGAVSNVPGELRAKYFHSDGRHFRINDRIRTHVRWEVQNLLEAVQPGPWDVVLWRNCAIYLRAECVHSVYCRLIDELVPAGLLVTGRAERPTYKEQLRRLSGCIYRKVGTAG